MENTTDSLRALSASDLFVLAGWALAFITQGFVYGWMVRGRLMGKANLERKAAAEMEMRHGSAQEQQ